jgi:CO/xanthine dehydrogenase FAD-binding subunit
MLQSLQLLQPTSVSEASAALVDFGDKAKIYAGGAELLLLLRNGLLQTEVLVDVKKISRLHQISFTEPTLHIKAPWVVISRSATRIPTPAPYC